MIQLAFAAYRQLSIWWLKATTIYYYSLLPGGQLGGWAEVTSCARAGCTGFLLQAGTPEPGSSATRGALS